MSESENQSERACPWCAESIRPQARRCPHCRSRLVTFQADVWHRDHPERMLAGVASAVAHALQVPVAMVRLAFVVLAFANLLGVLLYGALWLVMPQSREHGSLAEALSSSLGSALREGRCSGPKRSQDPVP